MKYSLSVYNTAIGCWVDLRHKYKSIGEAELKAAEYWGTFKKLFKVVPLKNSLPKIG